MSKDTIDHSIAIQWLKQELAKGDNDNLYACSPCWVKARTEVRADVLRTIARLIQDMNNV